MRTQLKRFQEEAVENAASLLGATLDRLATLRGAQAEGLRGALLRDAGAVLIEAPTGIGKTLMAAQTVGRLSEGRPMLWLWFAPFGSVVAQTRSVLADEVESLRARDPVADRSIEELRPGDVFVSTWAAVAVSDSEMRKIRRSSELAPSLDELLRAARLRGWSVGAVVDEAHHSFRGATRAYEFFRDVVDPDATILVTATPRDADMEAFRESVHLGDLRRIRVSRAEGVEAGLLKKGIKTAVFKAPATVEELLDFKRTALSQAVAVHRRIKALLAESGFEMTPLLMVQAESDEGIENARAWIKELGFARSSVMVHTAKEPDPGLNAVQGEEEVEVLIFKMAVALGFDAPRAFTLVSFRVSRDEDFGIQIVGRLMRVDRRLQGRSDLPEALDQGYVFLSDRESQTGILSAGDRINSIRSELASLSTHVDVAFAPDGSAGLVGIEGGQRGLFPAAQTATRDGEEGASPATPGVGPGHTGRREVAYAELSLWNSWGLGDELRYRGAGAGAAGSGARAGSDGTGPAPRNDDTTYDDRGPGNRLKKGPGYPLRFTRAEIDVLDRDVLGEVVDRFRWDDSVFTLAMTESQTILMEERDIFSGLVDASTEIRARLLREELSRRAQYSLISADRDGFLDRGRLFDGLRERLSKEAERRGLGGFDSPAALETALIRVLALRPSLLSGAVDETFARHTVTREAALLPECLDPAGANGEQGQSPRSSRLNLYGIMPPDLNNWERPFADLLDDDLGGLVRWWHRNPVRKAWSVALPVPGHGLFYPDLVVGVEGRSTRDGIVLVEIKHQINDPEGNAAAKARSRHPDYGPILMLYLDEAKGAWMTVAWDATAGRNVLDRVFRMELLRRW